MIPPLRVDPAPPNLAKTTPLSSATSCYWAQNRHGAMTTFSLLALKPKERRIAPPPPPQSDSR